MARKDKIKENYNHLRAAGYSAADARRMRYHSRENIEKAIKDKIGPVISPNKITRSEKVKENYNRLRAAGYSAADARRMRYHSWENIDKAIKDKIGPTVSKKNKARENYAKLRKAGFSATDARRYRNASAKNIEKAISKGIIPPKKKRTPRPKIYEKDFKASSLKSMELFDLSDKSQQQGLKFIKNNSLTYPFFSVVVSMTYASGQTISYSNPMNPTRDINNTEDLLNIIEDLITIYTDKYGIESSESPILQITLNLWKPKPGVTR